MGKYEWLLFLHVTGAFLFLGAAVVAGILNITALRRERPSEIAVLLRLAGRGVAAMGIGFFLLLIFGLWLVHVAGYSFGAGWVIASLVLFALSNALGGVGGNRDKATRLLAEQLAAADDRPSAELRARLRDPVSLALSYGSGLAALVVLVLMIWKPGAGG
jgi:uncharacterized membrane protein